MIGLRDGIGFAVVGAIVLFAWSNRTSYTPLDIGQPAPAYGAPSLDGDTLTLEALRGRVVVLNVWATWCTPCLEEMPSLQRLHERLAPRGLSVVAVSVDTGGDVRGFVDRLGLTFTILHDASGAIEDVFKVPGVPMTFVIDRNGKIRRKDLGPRTWDAPELASEIEALLED